MKLKHVKIFVFEPPARCSHVSPLKHSRLLTAFLKKKGVAYTEEKWDGCLTSLPQEPALVRASTHLSFPWEVLVIRCQDPGHVVFYDDLLVGPDGRDEGHFKDLLIKVKELLARLP